MAISKQEMYSWYFCDRQKMYAESLVIRKGGEVDTILRIAIHLIVKFRMLHGSFPDHM
jgi:hypothetical protein